MSYHYRCNRCRGRNVLARPLGAYKRDKACRHCGHARFYVDKERHRRMSCFCSGAYHWGAHRPGSPTCEHNPLCDVNRARRSGCTDAVVAELIRKALMEGQIGIEGIEQAPPPLHLQVAVLGMLWKPARILRGELTLEVWILQPGDELPVVSFFQSTDMGVLVDLEQQMQRIGTAVLARGYGLNLAVVESRECLRIGHTQHVGLAPVEEAVAA